MGRIVANLRQSSERFRRAGQNRGPQRPGQTETMTDPTRTNSLSGAIARAALVALVLLMPALLIPTIPPETAQVLLLVALFAAAVVMAEYLSSYPALIEFRFAAPFNRTRFALLALLVVALSFLKRGQEAGGALTDLVAGVAAACGRMLDVPFSPVRQLLALMPDPPPSETVLLIRDGASLGLVLALTTVAGFVTAIRMQLWPMGQGPFNVWINLPTFEPTAGNDVVLRLQRHARVNVALGVMMPFVLPGLALASAIMVRPLDLGSPVSFVWGLALWAFIPAALIMRGVAMARLAQMIRANRRRYADSEGNAFATA